jgi:hypothetical protein
MQTLTNQLEMIRPQLNLRPSPVETRPSQPATQAPMPASVPMRIPAKVTRDGVSWSPTCWYNPKSNHDRQRAMRYLQEALSYGVSIDPTSRWAVEIGNRKFQLRDANEITAWVNG